jgi:hypothetical protein
MCYISSFEELLSIITDRIVKYKYIEHDKYIYFMALLNNVYIPIISKSINLKKIKPNSLDIKYNYVSDLFIDFVNNYYDLYDKKFNQEYLYPNTFLTLINNTQNKKKLENDFNLLKKETIKLLKPNTCSIM